MVFFASQISPNLNTEPSQFGGQGKDFVAPSTADVVAAYSSEALFGVGTAAADVSALKVNQFRDSGTLLTEDQYKASPNYRSSISYVPGMTEEAAKELAVFSDKRKENSEIIGAASLGQDILGVATGFTVGVFEPKNVALGVATSVAITPALGWLAPAASSFRKVLALKKIAGNYGAKAGIGAAEGFVGAALAEPSNRYSASILQQDYTAADTILNIGLSSAFGAAFNVAPSFIADKWKRYKSTTPDIVAQELDVATSQLLDSQVTRVEHVELSKLQSDLSLVAKRIITEVPERQTDLVPLLADYVKDNRERISSYEGGADLIKVIDKIDEYKQNVEGLRSELLAIEGAATLDPVAGLEVGAAKKLESINSELSSAGLKPKRKKELLREKEFIEGAGRTPAASLAKEIEAQAGRILKKQRELEELTALAVNSARVVSGQIKKSVDRELIGSAKVENNALYDGTGIDAANARSQELASPGLTPEQDYKQLMDQLSIMKKEGLISDEEVTMLSDATGAIKESDMKVAYDSLLVCMTGA